MKPRHLFMECSIMELHRRKLIILLIIIVVLLYATLIEPNLLCITTLEFHSSKLTTKEPIVIAHISDLHIRHFGVRESKLADILNKLKPDLVLITGDLIESEGGIAPLEQLLLRLENMTIIVTLGNWDHRSGCTDKLLDTLKKFNVIVLRNENTLLHVKEQKLYIVGVDDFITGHAHIEKAFLNVDRRYFVVAIMHSPDLVSDLAEHRPDLILVGHTHGGQVLGLLIGPILRLIAGEHVCLSGLYVVKGVPVYVTRGIGCTLFDLRLLCPPEIAIIRLIGKSSCEDDECFADLT